MMCYEIRVKKYMGTGSTSLEKYYKNKAKAEEVVHQLNQYLPNMYFVKEIEFEDEKEHANECV